MKLIFYYVSQTPIIYKEASFCFTKTKGHQKIKIKHNTRIIKGKKFNFKSNKMSISFSTEVNKYILEGLNLFLSIKGLASSMHIRHLSVDVI